MHRLQPCCEKIGRGEGLAHGPQNLMGPFIAGWWDRWLHAVRMVTLALRHDTAGQTAAYIALTLLGPQHIRHAPTPCYLPLLQQPVE